MCTVTFIPDHEKVFITSGRDENNLRSPAIPPQPYPSHLGKIFFPKDGEAGGTWFAVHENGNVLVLLNGGFEFHASVPPYRKSRGLILVELAGHETPFNFFRSISLDEIEPFTVVIWENENLFECRWDGEKKYAKHLDKTIPHIWSSATLYSDEISGKRKARFEEWVAARDVFVQSDIVHFHRFSGDDESRTERIMNPGEKVAAVSITGVAISETKGLMTYLDLLNNKTYLQHIEFHKEWAGR